MILSCPKCSSRFSVDSAALAPEGKNVRCSDCGEVWYQVPDFEELEGKGLGPDIPEEKPKEEGEPVQDEVQEGDADSEEGQSPEEETAKEGNAEEDIPESLKSGPQEMPLSSKYRKKPEEEKKRQIPAIVKDSAKVAAVLILVGLAALFSMPSFMVKNWPKTKAFYNVVGVSPDVPGEGLVFDRIEVSAHPSDNHEKILLTVEGSIINLTFDETIVPYIRVTLHDKAGEPAEHWLIEPPVLKLAGESTQRFKAAYEVDPVIATNLQLKFVLKPPRGAKVKEAVVKSVLDAMDEASAAVRAGQVSHH